jgi:lysophospholipase L1-like esterase
MTDPRTPGHRRAAPPQGDPLDGRRDDTLPYGRRRRTAASALIAMLVALLLGALLNAPAMQKTAQEMPFGAERSFRLALVDPLASVSHWFFLDRPAKLTAAALGKPDPGPAGPSQVVVVVPTPTPTKGGDDEPGQQGDKPKKTLQEKPLPKPFKGHPMHLYIAGDSMMGLPGMALTNLSNKTKLIKPMLDYHISTGLVRPDFFNWPAQIQQQVKGFEPGAAAVMFGANDNQAVQTSSGTIHQFGSDGWKKEYRKRVEDVIGLLFQGGVRRVYWIGQPVMPEASFNNQVRLMNDIYSSVAEKTFGVEYIDAYALLSKDGAYSQYLPGVDGKTVQAREQDGEHLTYAGGSIVAKAVLDAIKKEWFPKKGEGPPPPSPKPSKSATPAP